MSEPTVPLPPPWLDGEDFPRLNTAFYGNEPHEYFDRRLALLMAHAGRPEQLAETIRGGIEYRGLKAGAAVTGADEQEEPEDSDNDEKLHLQFVITESVSLLHYASETLLRFYLAHVARPPCPWLEIARELSHVNFKRKVRARFDWAQLTTERREEIAWTFMGSKLPVDGVPPDVWNASVENIERWLTHFADWFLNESNLFNATKHGLAVQPGESSLQLMTPVDDEGKPLLQAEGPSVSFLEKRGDPYIWHHTNVWVDPARLMGETSIALRLLKAIWELGRVRYTDLQPRPERLSLWGKPDYEEYVKSALLPGEPAKIILNRVSMNLSYRYAYQPELVCVSCGRTPEQDEKAHATWRGRRSSEDQPFETLCPACASFDP